MHFSEGEKKNTPIVHVKYGYHAESVASYRTHRERAPCY